MVGCDVLIVGPFLGPKGAFQARARNAPTRAHPQVAVTPVGLDMSARTRTPSSTSDAIASTRRHCLRGETRVERQQEAAPLSESWVLHQSKQASRLVVPI